MKKEDITGLIVYIIIFAVVLVLGLTVISDHAGDSNMRTGAYVGYVLGALIVGIIFNAIIYELGHILGAKMGGYMVASVNILFFNWYKDNGHWKFRFKSYDGLTGETIIVPKERSGKEPHPAWNIWMGTILYAVELIVVIILFSNYSGYIEPAEQATIPIWSNVTYALLIIAIMGAIIVFYNILPLHLDSMTDGYKLTVTTNKANAIAYNALLRVSYEVNQGNKDVEIPIFDKITDFTADLNLNKVYLLLDDKKFDEAEPLLDQIIDSKQTISQRLYIRTVAQKIYIYLAHKPKEEAQAYYDSVDIEVRRKISEDTGMPCIRAYLLMAGILDKSESECLRTIEKTKKALKSTPEARRPIERQLFNEAILMVDAAHPSWGLKSHLLQQSSSASSK